MVPSSAHPAPVVHAPRRPRRRARGASLAVGAVALLGASLVPLAARADIYTFVDENGVMHVSNVPRDRDSKMVVYEERPWRKPALFGNQRYDELIVEAAREHRLDPALVKAVIHAESYFNHLARSHKGAMGLMQLMPATARSLGVEFPYEPRENIGGGTKYLRKMLDKFGGDQRLALAAYNAGPSNVAKYKGVPPFEETQDYVRSVRRLQLQYRGTLVADASSAIVIERESAR